MKHWIFGIGLIFIVVQKSTAYTCNRTPKYSLKPKLPNERYAIDISGNPKGYIPKETYTITLRTDTPPLFTEFFIVAEPENPIHHQGTSVGKFFPFVHQDLAKYSSECPNAIIQTTPVPKLSVSVQWKAPTSDSGCIAIKATVIESGDSWYSDDGALTRVLCFDEEKNEDIQPMAFPFCSACNEAKYEIAFQGMWSRNTHPKNFPADMWSTKLGDIVGASHKFGKSFWNYGAYASDGLKSLAEEGDTKTLETELIEMLKNDDVRTIIKARELSHPNITGTSYTVFRADRENHLLSLVSKITPSPDWVVGVSSLELCSNGTWADSINLNLYPWDVGTDDGLTYDSPASPSHPRESIRRIKSNSPNKEESPFYSEDGTPIKPVAKLHVTRQKIYEKFCEQEPQTEDNNTDKCVPSDWGGWSNCSISCFRTRERKFTNSEYEEFCSQREDIKLQETEKCKHECESQYDDCTEDWGPWSPCSTTCGAGIKERTRPSANEEENNEDDEEDSCPSKDTVQCYNEDCEVVTEGRFRGPADPDSQLITQSPYGVVIDCKTSDWSDWNDCSATTPCTRGYQYKERHIVIHPQNGGKPCPSKLRKRKRCKVPCSRGSHSTHRSSVEDDTLVDCEMGPWSSWSPCSSNCGHAVQQRTREIIKRPKNGGRPCGPRIQEKKCPLPLACADRESLPFYV